MSARMLSRPFVVVVLACAALSVGRPAFAQRKFLIFGDNKVSYKAFKDAAGRFELEYPTKDWGSVPAGGSTLAIFSRNDRTATVVIDLAKLSEPLAPAEVSTNAQIEIETLKEQQPNAKDFKSEVLDAPAGRASLIRYARVGANGPERVLRYSIAIGLDLFHLDAVVQEGSLAKHEPVVLHMFQSFKAPASSATAKH